MRKHHPLRGRAELRNGLPQNERLTLEYILNGFNTSGGIYKDGLLFLINQKLPLRGWIYSRSFASRLDLLSEHLHGITISTIIDQAKLTGSFTSIELREEEGGDGRI